MEKDSARGRVYSVICFFALGVAAGILAVNFAKSYLLEDMDLFGKSFLYGLEGRDADGRALFYYLLGKRWKDIFLIIIFSTTYLGYLCCSLWAVWYGMTAGAYFSALFLKYGLRGIFLAFMGIMPQYLIYFPALLLLLVQCENVYERIYIQKERSGCTGGGKRFWGRVFLKIAGIALLVLTGCILESYVNPLLVGAVM